VEVLAEIAQVAVDLVLFTFLLPVQLKLFKDRVLEVVKSWIGLELCLGED